MTPGLGLRIETNDISQLHIYDAGKVAPLGLTPSLQPIRKVLRLRDASRF